MSPTRTPPHIISPHRIPLLCCSTLARCWSTFAPDRILLILKKHRGNIWRKPQSIINIWYIKLPITISLLVWPTKIIHAHILSQFKNMFVRQRQKKACRADIYKYLRFLRTHTLTRASTSMHPREFEHRNTHTMSNMH